MLRSNFLSKRGRIIHKKYIRRSCTTALKYHKKVLEIVTKDWTGQTCSRIKYLDVSENTMAGDKYSVASKSSHSFTSTYVTSWCPDYYFENDYYYVRAHNDGHDRSIIQFPRFLTITSHIEVYAYSTTMFSDDVSQKRCALIKGLVTEHLKEIVSNPELEQPPSNRNDEETIVTPYRVLIKNIVAKLEESSFPTRQHSVFSSDKHLATVMDDIGLSEYIICFTVRPNIAPTVPINLNSIIERTANSTTVCRLSNKREYLTILAKGGRILTTEKDIDFGKWKNMTMENKQINNMSQRFQIYFLVLMIGLEGYYQYIAMSGLIK